jgi:hypothetical protein
MKNIYILLLTLVLASYWVTINGQEVPKQGEILISEIMVNPDAVSDANGEWFEIWNATNHDLLLNGLTIKDGGSNKHLVVSTGKLIITANEYWVLARNGDILTNGGALVKYTFQNFTLSNTSDQIIITAPDGTLIDQVSYGAGWPIVSGASMELQPDFLSFGGNDLADHWHQAKLTFGRGDKGSPGQSNPVSAGVDDWAHDIKVKIFPNPTSGRFILEATFPKPFSGDIRFVNLLGQYFTYKSFSYEEVIREVVDTDILTPGIWFIEVFVGGKVKTTRLVIER